MHCQYFSIYLLCMWWCCLLYVGVCEGLRMCARHEIDTVRHLSHITCSLRRSQHTPPSGTLDTPTTHTHTKTRETRSLCTLLLTFVLSHYIFCVVFLKDPNCVAAFGRQDLLKAALWIFHDVWCSDMRKRQTEIGVTKGRGAQHVRVRPEGGWRKEGDGLCHRCFCPSRLLYPALTDMGWMLPQTV